MTSTDFDSGLEILAALSTMANVVGHELRNPLAVIQNGVYLLGMMLPDADPHVKETLDLVANQVDEVARLTNSLLDFGRPRRLQLQDFNINAVLIDVLAETRVPEDIEIAMNLDPELPAVAVDVAQLRLALSKLMDNAVKALPEGEQPGHKQITLSTSAAADWVVTTIADTGAGIPDADLPHIFDPLFTTRTASMGLGLSVARAVIEAHRGTIEVSSRVREGTTFTVRLPRTRQPS